MEKDFLYPKTASMLSWKRYLSDRVLAADWSSPYADAHQLSSKLEEHFCMRDCRRRPSLSNSQVAETIENSSFRILDGYLSLIRGTFTHSADLPRKAFRGNWRFTNPFITLGCVELIARPELNYFFLSIYSYSGSPMLFSAGEIYDPLEDELSWYAVTSCSVFAEGETEASLVCRRPYEGSVGGRSFYCDLGTTPSVSRGMLVNLGRNISVLNPVGGDSKSGPLSF